MANPIFYLTSDQAKTPLDPFAQAAGTKLTVASFSNSHPERTYDFTMKADWLPAARTVTAYLAGDATKAPIDPLAQAAGTKIVLVKKGKETEVEAGNLILPGPLDARGLINILREMNTAGNGARPSDPTSF